MKEEMNLDWLNEGVDKWLALIGQTCYHYNI